MQSSGIGSNLVRVLTTAALDPVAELFPPGRVLEAEVVSVFQGRAVLAFGRGVRLEATVQTPLQEGQRIRVQVQPPESGAQSPGQQTAAPQSQPPTVVLKVIGPAQQPPAQPAAPAQPSVQAQPGAPAQPVPAQVAASSNPSGAPSVLTQDALAPMPPAPQAQPGAPQVLWLPIPLPDGRQGWAQLHVQEDASPRTRALRGGPVRQVRLWWETPGLGPVQVTLDAAGAALTAIFAASAAETRSGVEQGLADLQTRLAAAGFPDARVGCRAPAPGESLDPVRPDGFSRLDKRL